MPDKSWPISVLLRQRDRKSALGLRGVGRIIRHELERQVVVIDLPEHALYGRVLVDGSESPPLQAHVPMKGAAVLGAYDAWHHVTICRDSMASQRQRMSVRTRHCRFEFGNR
jgi:hypothetical protein